MVSEGRIFKGPEPLDGRKPDCVLGPDELTIQPDNPQAISKNLKKRPGTWVGRACIMCGAYRHIPKPVGYYTCDSCTPPEAR